MGQQRPVLLLLFAGTGQFAGWSQQGSDSPCQSHEHSPVSAGTDRPTHRAVPAFAFSNERVTESARGSQRGVCLQQSKQLVCWGRSTSWRTVAPSAPSQVDEEFLLHPYTVPETCENFPSLFQSHHQSLQPEDRVLCCSESHIAALRGSGKPGVWRSLFSLWPLEYGYFGVPCAQWDRWCCSSVRDGGRTLVPCSGMGERRTNEAFSNFTITRRHLGPANAEGKVKMMKNVKHYQQVWLEIGNPGV